MQEYVTRNRIAFHIFNYIFIGIIAFVCLAPIFHVLALSLSSASEAVSGNVWLWPLRINFASYKEIMSNTQFLKSFWMSCKMAVVGTLISVLISILTAYPLSKMYLKGRTWLAWFFVITMLFQGGLIPWYMTIKYTGLLNTFWLLVIPNALHVFDIILLLNFFRNFPRELEEASMVDGAGHWVMLIRIYLPLSVPALATVTLLTFVGYRNSWFEGMILINSPTNWPLQTFLQSLVVFYNPQYMTITQLEQMEKMSNLTLHSAELFVTMIPILIAYPFIQRFFIRGITLGSIKE